VAAGSLKARLVVTNLERSLVVTKEIPEQPYSYADRSVSS